MKRRNILAAAAALATGASTVGVLANKPKSEKSVSTNVPGSPAISKNMRQLRLTTSWPKDFRVSA